MPKYNNHKKTLKYSDEFKGKAVVLTHQKDARVKVIATYPDTHANNPTNSLINSLFF